MYRVVNVEELFRQLDHHRFGYLTCKVKFTINDNLVDRNNNSFVVRFKEGKASISSEDVHDVEVKIDISDFSSLMMNSVNMRNLYQNGLLEISEEGCLDLLSHAFSCSRKPICMTAF